jgi:hypothetical protein
LRTSAVFDPDALLAALPMRQINLVSFTPARTSRIPSVTKSALGNVGEYNGFSHLERSRTARLSNRLVQLGATARPTECDICGCPAADEHAENYYDISRWVGLCKRCHRNALHNRFKSPDKWTELLDRCGLPDTHWARLVASEPFDLAGLLRTRGIREPQIVDFLLIELE